MTALRLLVLGAGAVVTEYYAPALRMLGWQDAHVVDPSPGAFASVRAAYPEAILHSVGFREALMDDALVAQVDAVVVALPNSLHEEAVELALQHRLHVLCEKPLARTRQACLRLADAAQRAQRILTVGMVRRLLPSLSMLHQAVLQRLIGDVLSIDVADGEPYAWLSESGSFFRPENGGVLADMGVHYLDLIEELAGELTPLRYRDDCRAGVEANVEYELKSSSVHPIRLVLSRTKTLRNTFVVHGTYGQLTVYKDRFDSCTWRSCATEQTTRLVPESSWEPTLQACFARQLEEFASAIADNSAPRVSAARAASTIGLVEWAYHHRESVGQVGASTCSREPRLTDGRICVTGATGFIGTHLVERLFESGHARVVAPVRNYRTCARIGRFPIELPRWDLLDYASVKASVAGARFVFHLAYGRDGPAGGRVTVEGTRNVVRAAVELGCESVVVLSSIYVFGQPNAEVDETWPLRPTGGVYGLSKAIMERVCFGLSSTFQTTRIVVLCPSCVYGPGGPTYIELPARLAREGSMCLIENGQGTANYTYVENLIDAMLLAAVSPAAHAQRFIVNDGWTTWHAYLGALLGPRVNELPSYTRQELENLHRRRARPSALDVGRRIVSDQQIRSLAKQTLVGELALGAAARVAPTFLERLRQIPAQPATSVRYASTGSGMDRPLPPVWLADLFGPARTTFVAERAQNILGWTPRVSLEAGMQASRAWLQDTGYT